MNYFTADLHFNDAKLVERRGFQTLEEMNEALIANWNARITDEDHVYIAGDMFVSTVRDVMPILERLKGHKHLAIGNHDRNWLRAPYVRDAFDEVAALIEIFDAHYSAVISHYPMLDWYRRRHGAYLIYGHIHERCDAPYCRYLSHTRNAYNAGIDVNQLAPALIEELRQRHADPDFREAMFPPRVVRK